MSEKTLLSKVERVLSSAWGGDVQLSIQEIMDEHPHVARLTVQSSAVSAPQTVFLKRARAEGEERFYPEASASHLLNDWASMEFLSTLLGDVSPAPQIYAADQIEGFFVTEDLGTIEPLKEAL